MDHDDSLSHDVTVSTIVVGGYGIAHTTAATADLTTTVLLVLLFLPVRVVLVLQLQLLTILNSIG